MASVTESSLGATEFVGVSSEPGRGVEEAGPYEFFTDAGVHVYLHDADFLGLVWHPEATMRLYFSYDQEWTPSDAKDTPVVELIFSQVQVLQWQTDLDALSETEPVLGQVASFDWDGREGFDLATYTLNLSFSSRRMEVRLIPSAPQALARAGGSV